MIYKQKFNELIDLIQEEKTTLVDLRWKSLDLKREAMELEEAEAEKQEEEEPIEKAETKAEFFSKGRKV